MDHSEKEIDQVMWKILSNRETRSSDCNFCSQSFRAIVLSTFNGKAGFCKIGSNSHKETEFYELSHCHYNYNWSCCENTFLFRLVYAVNTLINNLWLETIIALQGSLNVVFYQKKNLNQRCLSVQNWKTGESLLLDDRRENDGRWWRSSFRALAQGQAWGSSGCCFLLSFDNFNAMSPLCHFKCNVAIGCVQCASENIFPKWIKT